MKKILLLVFLTGRITTAFAQKVISVEKASNHSTYVKGDNFEGVIFDKTYIPPHHRDSTYQRFTPTVSEIELAESALHKQLKKLNAKRRYQTDSTAIDNHLSDFRRQYFGYIDAKGQKIISLNCFVIEEQFEKKWKTQYFYVFDGGAGFWGVDFNIKKGKLFGFGTNGIA